MPRRTPGIKAQSTGERKAKTSYRDENGNSWSGFGPKPAWLKATLAEGKPPKITLPAPEKTRLAAAERVLRELPIVDMPPAR